MTREHDYYSQDLGKVTEHAVSTTWLAAILLTPGLYRIYADAECFTRTGPTDIAAKATAETVSRVLADLAPGGYEEFEVAAGLDEAEQKYFTARTLSGTGVLAIRRLGQQS